jgi:hypothetical protein
MRALVRPYLQGVRRLHDPIHSIGIDLVSVMDEVEHHLNGQNNK